MGFRWSEVQILSPRFCPFLFIPTYLPLKNFISHKPIGSKLRYSKMGKVKKVKGQAWYLSKYLSGEDFERYYFSGGWVFPGWIGFSQWFKKEFGAYPKKEMLVELGKMSNAERAEHTWFGLYLWETRKKKRKVKDVLGL
jgi:hypothetical protein